MGTQKLEKHVYASSISNDTSLPGGVKHPHPARKKKKIVQILQRAYQEAWRKMPATI